MGAQLARQLTEILDQTAAGIEYVFRVVIPLICLLLVALAVLLFVVVSLMFGEGVGLILLHTLLLSAGVLITVVSLAFAGGCVALAIAGGCVALDLAVLHRLGSAAATEEALTDGSVPDATVAGPANSAALSVDSAAFGLILLHTLLLSVVVGLISGQPRGVPWLAIAGGCMALDLAVLHRVGNAAATEEALTDGSVPDATVAGPANSAALSVDSAAALLMLAVILLLVVWPWDRTRDPGTWPAVVGEVEGVELAQLRAFVDKACARQRRKYSFGIELVRAYELSQPQLRVRYEAFAEKQRRKGKPLEPQRLFHGTSRMSAQEIGRDGFALPRSGGMFGRGIYFTDCPLKSLEYTRGS